MRLLVFPVLLIGISGCIEKPEPEPKDKLDHKVKTELPKASYEVRQQVRDLLQKVRSDLVFVEGGSFRMGDIGETDADGDWLPWTIEQDDDFVHSVTLDSYALSRYETTWGELRLYFDAIGVDPFNDHDWRVFAEDDPESRYYKLKPAKAPSWIIANDYCQWLGKMTGLPFDLPTEAQWEYAARSRGKEVRFATHDGKLHGSSIDGKKQNYSNGYRDGTVLHEMPVGSYPPNPLGLYDMTGNIKEWTRDWYQPDYYEHSPTMNPQGPDSGYKRSKVIRDWGTGPGYASIPARGGGSYDNGSSSTGFRCAANINEPLEE